ncbi:hypothetical protein H6G89_11080 [Oscillatoria sp. FACHB-1407]|uniref:hypothetical protein n=1 Tax=Oscillatoria sp. FACHB-1407 TaxID=2692847 RepID=UPI0016885AA6|nr:hypothetical protein [Oscillatoria sp. FACHB-1407]MBD2461593.1 hypothetical protein [Oscillatoria sp. FACHB-1407]
MATATNARINARRAARLSEIQKQNIRKLISDVQASVDNAPSESSVADLKASVKAAFSDRTITRTEFRAIASDVLEVVESAGVTPTEARTIFYDLQNIAQASRFPRTNDNVTGTDGNDVIWTGLGNDTLTGATATDFGVGDVDTLCGGGGQDTFVLGNASAVFYDDGNSVTPGLNDYALIVDFNPTQDKIQLKGTAENYTVGALPEQLGFAGTGIYYKNATGSGTPELIGVVAGVSITDFNSGFTFV